MFGCGPVGRDREETMDACGAEGGKAEGGIGV